MAALDARVFEEPCAADAEDRQVRLATGDQIVDQLRALRPPGHDRPRGKVAEKEQVALRGPNAVLNDRQSVGVSDARHGEGLARNSAADTRAARHVPLGLGLVIEKRAELAGEVRALEDRLDQLRADLIHLDATIRILSPSFQTEAIVPKQRRQRRGWFANGELLRAVLECLRRAPEPVTAKEVAQAIMERKGLDATDAATVRLVEKRVFSTLKRRAGSLVEEVVYGPRAVGWRVRG
jgi:hypothetical protein